MFLRNQIMEMVLGCDTEHGVLFCFVLLPVSDREPMNDFKQGSNVIGLC